MWLREKSVISEKIFFLVRPGKKGKRRSPTRSSDNIKSRVGTVVRAASHAQDHDEWRVWGGVQYSRKWLSPLMIIMMYYTADSVKFSTPFNSTYFAESSERSQCLDYMFVNYFYPTRIAWLSGPYAQIFLITVYWNFFLFFFFQGKYRINLLISFMYEFQYSKLK